MLRFAPLLVFLLVLATLPTAAAAGDPVADWETVLDRFVDDRGLVAFDSLAADRAALDRYLAWVESIAPWARPEAFPTAADALAFHLNAYNALAMRGVLEAGLPEDLDGVLARYRFFRRAKVVVGGREMNLESYENDVIRGFDEPRVHFALNCMSAACPRLRREPFRGSELDAQLEDSAREFLDRERNVRIEDDRRTVRLSEILKWFREDFSSDRSDASLLEFVNRYREQPVPTAARVRFIPYDWSVVHQR